MATDGNEILMCRIIKHIKIQKLAVQFYQLLLKLVSYNAPYFYFTCLTPGDSTIGVRDRGQEGGGNSPQNFGKHARKNQENSGRFIRK